MYRSARRVSRCGQDYWVTFNGEIYNVERIRQTLEEDGERFHTGTDTPITNGCFGLTAPKDSDCRGKGWEGALDAPGAAQAGRAVHAALVDRFRDRLPRLRPPLSLVYIFDDCSRECPGLLVDTSSGGVSVTRFLDELAETHGPPGTIVVDNVTGFTSRAFLAWVEKHGITLRFIDPGKPNQNAFVESFNGRFRDECLDGH